MQGGVYPWAEKRVEGDKFVPRPQKPPSNLTYVQLIHSSLLAHVPVARYNVYMATRSEARQAYWAKIPPEIRSERARKAVLARHSKTTPAEKRAFALKLVEARRKK